MANKFNGGSRARCLSASVQKIPNRASEWVFGFCFLSKRFPHDWRIVRTHGHLSAGFTVNVLIPKVLNYGPLFRSNRCQGQTSEEHAAWWHFWWVIIHTHWHFADEKSCNRWTSVIVFNTVFSKPTEYRTLSKANLLTCLRTIFLQHMRYVWLKLECEKSLNKFRSTMV